MNKKVIHHIGLHPLVAFGMIAVDMMLFGGEATPVGWVLSTVVAAVLVIPCIIMQRFSYKDKWIIAVAKGLFVGILTAIPTPLPALLTGIGGIMGLLSSFKKTEIPEENK